MGSTTQRQIAFIGSLVILFVIAFQIISSLSSLQHTVSPETYFIRVAVALTAVLIPICGAWYAFHLAGGITVSVLGAVLVFFVGSLTSSSAYIWFPFEYGAFCFLLHRMDQYFENRSAIANVDRETFQGERNDLEVSHKSKGEGISMLFEKYSTYYNLRKLAEDLAATLSVEKLSQVVVDRTMDFIPRGNIAFLSIARSGESKLELLAFRALSQKKINPDLIKRQKEDVFDYWVIKNRRRLIVIDTQQDFRFDASEAVRLTDIRSLILAPLLHEGRVIGTLRIHSSKAETFSNDDLRLLDIIAVLASSALSNAMLYEQTRELAIRDSLTGLFVRRFFFERFKEEHRRALMTKRPLTLLMCDVDHFKECNDKYGHTVGDLILVHITKILKDSFDHAVIGRYGGEEFMVLLPETAKAKAVDLANGLRRAVENAPFAVRREMIRVTVSIGVSSFPDDALDMETLVKKSDEALYEAKRTGRNKVCSSIS